MANFIRAVRPAAGFGHGVRRGLARISVASLITLSLLPVFPQRFALAVIQPQQGEKGAAARKLFEEGFQLYQQGSAEALRGAISRMEQALSLWRELNDGEAQTLALLTLGRINDDLGNNQRALELYTQALRLCLASGNRQGQVVTLNNIGGIYDALGEKQQALGFYNQALPLLRAADDRGAEAVTLNNIGLVYSALGEKQKALDHYAQALALGRAAGDRSREAITLNNIGAVYHALGEKQKALDFFTQALSVSRAAGDRRDEAVTLGNIGSVYDTLGEKQEALGFYNQALPLWRAVGDRGQEATALNNIGTVYQALGEKQKALNFFTLALPLSRAVGDRSGEAVTLNNIGAVREALGEKQKALDYYKQALLLSRAVGDRGNEAVTLGNIAVAERTLGRLTEARAHTEECLKITEALRTGVVSRELRASFFATVQGDYEFYIDLLMQLHRQEPGKNHQAAALQAAERARARSLLESLTEARADIRQGVDPALLARERSVQQRLNAKAEAQFKLLNGQHTEEQAEARRKELDELTTGLQQVQTQIRQTSPRYAALTQPQPLTPAEIQQVLDADTLLLEYALGKERSFLWAVTPTSLTSCELPKAAEIEAAARRVYELLIARSQAQAGETSEQKRKRVEQADTQYSEAASRLSRMLLGPVAGQLGQKRLVVVADGPLHYIPFGALPLPAGEQKDDRLQSFVPLIAEHEIINLPSASTLAVLRRELKDRKPAAKMLAVLADPVFTRDDERFKAVARQADEKKTEPSLKETANEHVVRLLAQNSDGTGDLRIKRLPFTRQEAERLLALVAPGAGLKAIDFEASRATVESDRLSRYRYVHIATHGLADSERPELSTVLLSLFDEQGRKQDGFLRAHEVFNLNLPAELVVLSACETGLGTQTRGEGLVSLTRGFMYAGAARVVVSLWSVGDKATAELMEKFYRRMLREGERPAAALRAAQIEMWRNKQWAAPYYWAAFTLQGEWR